jgi:tetratricopeptide (TPR) repeat protein
VKELFRALMRERLKPEELQLLHLRTLEELPWRDIARIMSDSAGEPSPGELERFAGALRQQFQRLKVRLQEIAVDAGLLAGLGEGGSPTLETVSKLERALKLLRGLPDASQRAETEFQLLMALGLARLQVEGCSPKLEATYARARELLFQVGEALPRLELSYWGIYSYDLLMGRFGQAHVLSQHLVTLGERLRNQELLAHGLRMMASDLFIAGDHPGALAHVERALPCSNFPLDVHRKLAMKQWLDPRASALAFASLVYSVAAQWDRARECTQEAVELAGRIGHPYTRAFVLAYAALGCQLRGEPASAVEWARAAQRLSHEHRFRVWESWARLVQGWAMAMRGEFQEGLERFDASLDQWRRSGFQAGLALFLGMRAEVLLRLGRPEEALETTTQGLAEAERTGERTNVAELHRLRGESLRLLGREDLAQASFLRALVLAREQGAHAFAQRAEAALSGGGSWDAAPH